MGSMQPIKPMLTAAPLYCLPYDLPVEPIALFASCANVSYDDSLIVFARNGRCQEGRRGEDYKNYDLLTTRCKICN